MILILVIFCYKVDLLLSAWKVHDSKAATTGKLGFTHGVLLLAGSLGQSWVWLHGV